MFAEEEKMSEEKLAKLVEPYLGKQITLKIYTWIAEDDDNSLIFEAHNPCRKNMGLDGVVADQSGSYLVGHDEKHDYLVAGHCSDNWNRSCILSIFCKEYDLSDIIHFLGEVCGKSIFKEESERNPDSINQFLLPEYLDNNGLKLIIAK